MKRKIRFNFIDLLIVLAVIALVAGVIWREELSDRVKTENIENTVTVCCDFNAFSDSRCSHAESFEEEGRTAVYINGTEAGYIETVYTENSGDAESAEPGGGESRTPAEESKIPADVSEDVSGNAENSGYNDSETESDVSSDESSAPPAESETEDDETTAPAEPQNSHETKLYLKAVARSSGYYIDCGDGTEKLLIGEKYSMNTKTKEFVVQILSVKEEQEA